MNVLHFDTPKIRAKAGLELLRQMKPNERPGYIRTEFEEKLTKWRIATICDKLVACRDIDLFAETLQIADPEAYKLLCKELAWTAFNVFEKHKFSPWKVIKEDLDRLYDACMEHIPFHKNQMGLALGVKADGSPWAEVGMNDESNVFPLDRYMEVWDLVIEPYFFRANEPFSFVVSEDGTPGFFATNQSGSNIQLFELGAAIERFIGVRTEDPLTSFTAEINLKQVTGWNKIVMGIGQQLNDKIVEDGLVSIADEMLRKVGQAKNYFEALLILRQYGQIELEYPTLYKEAI